MVQRLKRWLENNAHPLNENGEKVGYSLDHISIEDRTIIARSFTDTLGDRKWVTLAVAPEGYEIYFIEKDLDPNPERGFYLIGTSAEIAEFQKRYKAVNAAREELYKLFE